MRPRAGLKAVSSSRNSASSSPGFQSNRISASVTRPSRATAPTSAWAQRSAAGPGRVRNHSAAEQASRPRAALAFICAAPGITLRSAGRSNAQPTSTAKAMSADSAQASRANFRRGLSGSVGGMANLGGRLQNRRA